jgi:hypothetical protein
MPLNSEGVRFKFLLIWLHVDFLYSSLAENDKLQDITT